MRFEVKYIPSRFNWSIVNSSKKNINFQDKGFVFLQNIGLVFQGNKPKFDMGVFNYCLDFLLFINLFINRELFYVKTTITVPYSTIINYIKPKGQYHYHQINYRLPNGKQYILKFYTKLPGLNNINNEKFASKLEEYINSAKSFIDS